MIRIRAAAAALSEEKTSFVTGKSGTSELRFRAGGKDKRRLTLPVQYAIVWVMKFNVSHRFCVAGTGGLFIFAPRWSHSSMDRIEVS